MIKEFAEAVGGHHIFPEETVGQYKVQIDFQEKDNLLAYFASKAEIPENCPYSLEFYFNNQNNPEANFPKAMILE